MFLSKELVGASFETGQSPPETDSSMLDTGRLGKASFQGLGETMGLSWSDRCVCG